MQYFNVHAHLLAYKSILAFINNVWSGFTDSFPTYNGQPGLYHTEAILFPV